MEGPLRYKSQKDIDYVIIRENNEGEFVQSGRQIYPKGTERVAHYAFKLAQKRNKNLTNVTKSNTLIHTLSFWDRVIEEVAEHYPDVAYRKMYVDAACANMVLHPEYFDVILTTNMIGGSGNINPEKDFPSMFEPIHGSAPDIAGKNIANPIGQIWSGALMLEHVGEAAAAADIVKAINKVTSGNVLTVDLNGKAGTSDVANAVIDSL